MFKLKLVLCLILLFSLNIMIGNAAEYNDWVSHNQTIKIGGKEYLSQTTPDILILREVNGSGKVVIPNDDTVKTYENYYFETTDVKNSLDDYLEEHGIDSIHASKEETNTYMHKLSVTEIKSQLKITREVEPSKPNIFDTIEITYSVENTGNKDLKGVEYKEDIPAFLLPKEYTYPDNNDKEAYLANKRKIRWTFNVDQDETKELKGVFDIIGVPQEGQIFKLNKASASYDSPSGELSKWIDKQSIEVVTPFECDFTGNHKDVVYGDLFDFSFDFSNKHSTEEMKINNAKIQFCEHVTIDGIPDGMTKVDSYNYALSNANIEPSGLSSFVFEVSSSSLRNCPVMFDVDYDLKGVGFDESFATNITTETNKPGMKLSFDSISGDNVREGDDMKIDFEAENANDFDLDRAIIEIYSDFFSKKKFVFVGVGDGGKAANDFLTTIPSFQEDKKEKIYMNVTLVSSSGSEAEYQHTEQIKIDKGLADKIFDFSGSVKNVTNGTYYTELDILKLNDAGLNNMTVRLISDGLNKLLDFSDEDISKLKSSGKSITKKINLSFSGNDTIHNLSINMDAMVEGRIMNQEETFILNGTQMINLNKIVKDSDEVKNNSSKKSSAGDNTWGGSGSRGSFNLSVYIVIGFIVLGIIIAVFAFFNRDSAVTRIRKSKAININDFGKQKKRKDSGEVTDTAQIFDAVKNDYFNTNTPAANDDNSAPSSDSDISKLEGYINQRLSNGDSKSKIRKELKGKGWLDDVLDIFLK